MTTKDTGGPAFPQMKELGDSFMGLSLRDYFAAKAIHAFIVEPQWGDNNSLVHEWGKRLEAAPGTPDRYAQVAYMLADAMLAERSKQ